MHKTCFIIGLGNIGADYDLLHKDNSKIFTHAKAIKIHKKFKLIGGIDKSKKKKNSI